jgi:hypothetical protein
VSLFFSSMKGTKFTIIFGFVVTHIAANPDPTFRKKKNSENCCHILSNVPCQFLSSHISHTLKIKRKLFLYR